MSFLTFRATRVVLGWLLEARVFVPSFLTSTASGAAAMTERVLRCPYCVVGNEFMRMIALADGAFVCAKCGHLEIPGKDDLKCHCSRCIELRSLGFRRCG